MNENEAAKLQSYLQRWQVVYPGRWQQGAQVVANDLMHDAAFTDIKIAGLLESPGGATIAQVVQSALPFPASAEATVMIAAIEIAAKKQNNDQVVEALFIGAITTLVLWALFRGV